MTGFGARAAGLSTRVIFVAVAMLGTIASPVTAKPPPRFRKAPPPDPPLPPPAREVLPEPVEISRVDALESKEAALVTTDLLFAKARWDGASFDLYVAYGTPGMPAAFEARLVPLPDAAFLAPLGEVGEALVTEHATAAPSHAALSLGRRTQAGQIVHIDGPALSRAFGALGHVFLRLRTVHRFVGAMRAAPSVLVRLDTPGWGVLPLSLVTVRGEGDPGRARLCRLDGTTVPLRVEGRGEGVAPVLQGRTAGEDLCVEWR